MVNEPIYLYDDNIGKVELVDFVGDDLTILTRNEQSERNNAPYSQEGKPANPSPMSGLENNIEDSLPF